MSGPRGSQKEWDADIVLTSELATSLVRSQFPELSGPLEDFGEGWDNRAWLVDAHLFRFPRRQLAVPWMHDEIRWLPWLARQLPLPIPEPTKIGEPTEEYPFPFAGYRLLPGETACRRLHMGDVAAVGATLGRFLRSLHDLQVPDDAPRDDIHRGNLAKRVFLVPEPWRAEAEALAARPQHRETWCHGDVYARHILVDDTDAVGVIDWGDVHVGDPALDLGIALGFLAGDARAAFFDVYGPVHDDELARARFKALFYAAVLPPYAADKNDPPLADVAERARRLLGLEGS